MKFFPWDKLALPSSEDEERVPRPPSGPFGLKVKRFAGRTIIFIKRVARALRFLPVFILDAAREEGESCVSCGRVYRMAWSVPDDLWISVYGSENGCLCPCCFIRKANDKGIDVSREQIGFIVINQERVKDGRE